MKELCERLRKGTATKEEFVTMAQLRHYKYIDDDGRVQQFEYLFTLRQWSFIEQAARDTELPSYERMVEIVPVLANNPTDEEEEEDHEDDWGDDYNEWDRADAEEMI